MEQRGIEERPLLGRQKEKVRGNKINGVSETKQKGKHKANMDAADNFLGGKKVSELPTKEELSFNSMNKNAGSSH